jgi:hypothetical protein
MLPPRYRDSDDGSGVTGSYDRFMRLYLPLRRVATRYCSTPPPLLQLACSLMIHPPPLDVTVHNARAKVNRAAGGTKRAALSELETPTDERRLENNAISGVKTTAHSSHHRRIITTTAAASHRLVGRFTSDIIRRLYGILVHQRIASQRYDRAKKFKSSVIGDLSIDCWCLMTVRVLLDLHAAVRLHADVTRAVRGRRPTAARHLTLTDSRSPHGYLSVTAFVDNLGQLQQLEPGGRSPWLSKSGGLCVHTNIARCLVSHLLHTWFIATFLFV